MKNLARLNHAMDYIEANLTGDIEMKEVARIALCSEFHFSKMFSYLAGMQLSEYVRNRRMSMAVADLREANMSVMDVATKYGYSSADAFSRAFTKVHNVLPSKVTVCEASFKSYPKLSFEINITGGIEMEYRIVEKEQFNLIGLKKNVVINHSGVNPEIVAMYGQLTPEIINNLKALSDIEPHGMISASANFVNRHLDGIGTVDHIIGVASTQTTDEFEVVDVAASTWAVFTSCGPFPETLQQTWAKIYGQWFPSSNYVPTGGPELTWHESPDTTKEDYKSEIWIPVMLAATNKEL